jgi:hypothetical protein
MRPFRIIRDACAFVLVGDRQLKHRRLLAHFQKGHQDDATIREFEGVVMNRRIVLMDLTEDRCLVTDNRRRPRPRMNFPNLFCEGKFCSG